MRVKPLHTSFEVTKRKRVRLCGKKNELKRSIKDSTIPCVLCYANINGFTSKRDSLKQLIIENNIDILILTETKVYTKTKIRLEGYQVFPSVRKGKNGGGILVAIRHSLCSSVMIDEGENAEFVTVGQILVELISD